MRSPSPPSLTPAETYQVDSSEFDSASDAESISDTEYNALVQEGKSNTRRAALTAADAGLSDEQTHALVAELKETGLVNFLRSYLAPQPDGSRQSLRMLLLALGIVPPRSLRQAGTPDLHLLPFAKVALARVLRRRRKLDQYNTVDDAVRLLAGAKRILVLSGAGISTSCGIPDFRSATGLYANLQSEGKYDLDDPQQMFDISYFREHPEVFYSFARQIYPSNFVPSPCHRWIKLLEERGVLLRNYTQNIDTLESLAGVTNVLQCHGSFNTASCLRCKTRMPGSAIEPYIMSQSIPYCDRCREERAAEIAAIKAYRAQVNKNKKDWEKSDDEVDEWDGEPGIIKPDITFFGQALDSEFDECLFRDREEVDLLVIIGTSLKVAPVSEVLSHIPHSVPQIFINLTPVTHVRPDISLLGDADSIVTYLSDRLGWTIPPPAVTSPLAVTSPVAVREGGKLAVMSDEAEWVSGEGEYGCVHLLRRRGEGETGETLVLGGGEQEGGSEDDDEEDEEAQEPPEPPAAPAADIDGVIDGDMSTRVTASLAVSPKTPLVLLTPDDRSPRPRSTSPSGRPLKRSRVGTPESAPPPPPPPAT